MRRSTSSRRLLTAATAAVLAGSTALAGSALAGAPAAPGARAAESRTAQPEARGYYDSRSAGGDRTVARQGRTQAKAGQRASTRNLTRAAGGVLIDIDGDTGTPRMMAKLDGYLTGKSGKAPRTIVIDYVNAHRAALGLTKSDVKSLRFRDDYRDVYGTHHLSWYQVYGSTPIWGYGLQAAVNPQGRLLTLGGSPVPLSALPAPAAAKALPNANAAVLASKRQSGEARVVGAADHARSVVFVRGRSTYRAWETITMSAANPALSVFDAASGRLLFRRPLAQDGSAAERAAKSTGVAFQSYPYDGPGGKYQTFNFTKLGWLSAKATRLQGNNAHAFSDVNDDNDASKSEEVGPKNGHSWSYKLKPFQVAGMDYCDNPFPCSWDPDVAYSWKKNRAQNTTQVFYFVNNFHDVLLKKPVGFTEDAGNFEQKNSTGRGEGKDAVQTNTLDGANTGTGSLTGLPDGAHLDNANMSTPPDGYAPTMQMYLQHQPGTEYSFDGDPFPANNTGDESDTVYHEYTHGLSNRLVISPTGESSLGPVQAGSMGEAWSDFYALAYLVKKGFRTDRSGQADVPLALADGLGSALVRTEPIDCAVGMDVPECSGGDTGHTGGYTYADYGTIVGGPEVHGDGEIWGQTLWDLKKRLGYDTTLRLVTRAMELSPYNPSMLDQRNAILIADTNAFGGRHHKAIWQVFANRGMGYYAGALGGDDARPAADFHVPPATKTTGTISGTVTQAGSGDPAAGVPVTLAFQGGNTTVNPTAITDANGDYELGPVPVGTYAKLIVNGAGFEPMQDSVTVTTSGVTKDFAVARDWAAISGGAEVTDYNGPDYTAYGCGPNEAFDLSQAAGWSSSTGNDNADLTNVMVPKYVVVKLPQAITVSDFGVDPAATCGDGGSASTGDYKIETSPTGANGSWTTAATGTFTVGDRGVLNTVTPSAGTANVQYVKFWIMSNQTPSFATNCPGGSYSGCAYSDMTELTVHGQ